VLAQQMPAAGGRSDHPIGVMTPQRSWRTIRYVAYHTGGIGACAVKCSTSSPVGWAS
jgi:hypothetical protein